MPAARAVAAANTLWFEDDRLVADNTDGAGFMSHLRASVPGFDARGWPSPCWVPAARRAASSMPSWRPAPPEVRIFNRTRERADAVAATFRSRA